VKVVIGALTIEEICKPTRRHKPIIVKGETVLLPQIIRVE
jgi:hypothetical protein